MPSWREEGGEGEGECDREWERALKSKMNTQFLQSFKRKYVCTSAWLQARPRLYQASQIKRFDNHSNTLRSAQNSKTNATIVKWKCVAFDILYFVLCIRVFLVTVGLLLSLHIFNFVCVNHRFRNFGSALSPSAQNAYIRTEREAKERERERGK